MKNTLTMSETEWAEKHGIAPAEQARIKYVNPLKGRALKASFQPRDKRGRFAVDTRDALDFGVEVLR